jgi:hypothetical protein
MRFIGRVFLLAQSYVRYLDTHELLVAIFAIIHSTRRCYEALRLLSQHHLTRNILRQKPTPKSIVLPSKISLIIVVASRPDEPLLGTPNTHTLARQHHPALLLLSDSLRRYSIPCLAIMVSYSCLSNLILYLVTSFRPTDFS